MAHPLLPALLAKHSLKRGTPSSLQNAYISLHGRVVCLYLCLLLTCANLGSTRYVPGDPLQVRPIPSHPFAVPVLSSFSTTPKSAPNSKQYEGAPFSSLFQQGNHTVSNIMQKYKYCTGLKLPFFAQQPVQETGYQHS